MTENGVNSERRADRGADSPWLAGLAVLLGGFAAAWLDQPVADRSASGNAVEQVGLSLLFGAPTVAVVAAVLGRTRLRTSAAARWVGTALALLVLLPVGWVVAFWGGDLACQPESGGCTTTAASRAVGGTAVVAVWVGGWMLCRWATRHKLSRHPSAQ